MASEQQPAKPPIKRLPLERSGRRLSFERRLRLWLYLIGLPPVELPEVDRDNFDYADVLGSAIQFEDPKDERDVS